MNQHPPPQYFCVKHRQLLYLLWLTMFDKNIKVGNTLAMGPFSSVTHILSSTRGLFGLNPVSRLGLGYVIWIMVLYFNNSNTLGAGLCCKWPDDDLLINISMPSQIVRFMGPTWAHLGPVGPRWAPCWPHELCYQGCDNESVLRNDSTTSSLSFPSALSQNTYTYIYQLQNVI